MKIIFDRSENKLKDHQYVLCTKRPTTWSSKVCSGCIARYEGLDTFHIVVDTILYKGIFDVLPVIRLKSYVSVEVDD